MHELAPLIKDLAIILGIASIVTLLFQVIRQPVVLGYLLVGVIIGPYTPPYSLVSDIPNIKVIAELGVIFLMFSLGLEFSFHKLKRVGLSASVTGTAEVIFMLLLGFAAGQLIGWNVTNSIFLGAALSISSTTIILKALEELNLKRKSFAELIYGVLVVEDLLAILLLVALSTMAVTNTIFSSSIIWAAGKLILVVVSWFLIGYFLMPPLFRKVVDYINEETLTILSIALCLSLVCIASYFHYSNALGAFIMGSILAETAKVDHIEKLIRPIRDIFAAVFFVSVGMLIDPRIILAHWPLVLFITLVTLLGKIISSGLAAFLSGKSLASALRVGFGMAQIGEFSFIIVGLGTTLGITNNLLYPLIVAVSAITTFTTPYLIRLSGPVSEILPHKIPEPFKRYLNNYTTRLHKNHRHQIKHSFYRYGIVRFIINSIVVAIIFSACQYLLLPQLKLLSKPDWIIELISWAVAIIIASPFVWAMLQPFQILPKKNKKKLYALIAIAWFIVIFEISFFSFRFSDAWLIILLYFLITLSFVVVLNKPLGKIYHWFEKQLIGNLTRLEELTHYKFEELGPWDTHLVQLRLQQDSVIIGKTLKTCQLRQRHGLNIVAIQRNGKTILAPRGDFQFMLGDNLIILGNDAQIAEFESFIIEPAAYENDGALETFSLKPFLIKKNNALIGKSIRDSNIREQVDGVIVGLERQGSRILNPDLSMILQEGDLLFVVGKTERLNKLEIT